MNEQINYSESVFKYVSFLEKMDRAKLAELRRSAADPLNDYRSIWILGPFLPDSNGWPFDAYRLVATLYAIHKQHFPEEDLPKFKDDKKNSFGASVRLLRNQLKSAGHESLDKRFSALLNSQKEDLVIQLRGFIQRIATADTPISINYRTLLKDLIFWDGEFTRKKWARDYWMFDPSTSAQTDI